jgi:predicted branched-subunit amino acid permease
MGSQGDLHQDFVGMSTPVLFYWAGHLTMKGKIISKVICNFDIYIMMDFQICNLYLLLTILNMLSAEFNLKVCFVPICIIVYPKIRTKVLLCMSHIVCISMWSNCIIKSPNYKPFITSSHICEPYLWLTSWSSSLQPASDWLLSQNCVMRIICSR